jgi:hypothetical protein
MNITLDTQRDERTVAVENASYRWAYLILAFGALMHIAYQSYANHQTNWDLFVLIVLSGAVGRAYQARNKTLSRRWVTGTLIVLAAAAVIAALTTVFVRFLR